MTQRDPKDLADALAALAAGHHEEPEPGTDEHDHPAVPIQATPKKPAPAAQRPTPPVPPAKSPVPPPKKLEPKIPAPKTMDASSNFADAVAHLSEEDPAEAEEAIADSEVIAPAPTMDAFIPHYRTPVATKAKDPRSRRTLIPILLTSGVILLVIAGARLVMGPDSAMADIVPMWGAGVLLAAGAISLGLAAMNMIHVKNALARRGK